MILIKFVLLSLSFNYGSANSIFNQIAPIIISSLQGQYRSCIYFIEISEYLGISKAKEKFLISKHLIISYNLFVGSGGLKKEYSICEKNGYLFISLIDSTTTFAKIAEISEEFCRNEIRWLLFIKSENELFWHQFIKKGFIRFDCILILAVIQDNTIYLKEFYYITQKKFKITNFGRFDKALKKLSINIFDRRSDFENTTFPVSTSDKGFPVFIAEKDNNGVIINVNGLYGEIWKILEEKLNFRSRFLEAADQSWGKPLSNGSWDGMLGLVHRGEAFASLGDYSFYRERIAVFDFLMPFIHSRMQLYIKIFTSNSEELWWSFVKRIDYFLWLALIIIIITFSLTLSFFQNKLSSIGYSEPNEYNWTFFEILAIFCQQARPSLPKLSSCRILFLSGQLLSIILIAAFSAELISSLTILNHPPPFKNFREMLQNGNYRMGLLSKSGQLYAFQNMQDPLMKQIYEKLILPELHFLPKTQFDGLKQVCKRKNYAFMSWNYVAEGLMKYLPCQIQSISQASIPDLLSIILEKNSCYTRIFNYYIMKMRESGIINRITIREWDVKKIKRQKISRTSIDLTNVSTLIFFLIFGMNISLLMMFLENLFYKYILPPV